MLFRLAPDSSLTLGKRELVVQKTDSGKPFCYVEYKPPKTFSNDHIFPMKVVETRKGKPPRTVIVVGLRTAKPFPYDLTGSSFLGTSQEEKDHMFLLTIAATANTQLSLWPTQITKIREAEDKVWVLAAGMLRPLNEYVEVCKYEDISKDVRDATDELIQALARLAAFTKRAENTEEAIRALGNLLVQVRDNPFTFDKDADGKALLMDCAEKIRILATAVPNKSEGRGRTVAAALERSRHAFTQIAEADVNFR